MGHVIIILSLLFCGRCAGQESAAVSKFIEAAAVQTGLKEELEQSGKNIYTKAISQQYRPYFDAGVAIGNILATKQFYIKQTWEF